MGNGGAKPADSIARGDMTRGCGSEVVSKDEVYILHLIY